MGKSAFLRPPMPLVAVRKCWVAMAVGPFSEIFSEFPHPSVAESGGYKS